MPISDAQRAENEQWHRSMVGYMERGYPWRAVAVGGVWFLMTSNGQCLARFNLDTGHATRMAAAAPDLLAALKALVETAVAEVNEKGGAGGSHLARITDARAAITKAEDDHLPE